MLPNKLPQSSEMVFPSLRPQLVGTSDHLNDKTALAWRNVTIQVNEWSALKQKKKLILRQLSGSVGKGTLTGLLGPSGAGKTTLLNVLSGTETSGLTDDSAIYGRDSCPTTYYIGQQVTESIVGELTVGQILGYAYQFKNGLNDSKEEMEKFIANTLEDLLLDVAILERPFAVCSGGEQKRISIAQELMAREAPTFLLLDEPTTGLDSAAALEVMTSLRALTRTQSITVLASIHAPNDETLCLFDHLYVLAKGGVAIYSGPPNCIRTWLKDQLTLDFPQEQPPIEELIKVACGDLASPAVLTLSQRLLESQQCSLSTFSTLRLLPSGLPLGHRSFSLSHLLLQLSRLFRIAFLAQWRSLLLTLLAFLLYLALLTSLLDASMTSSSGCLPLNGSTSPDGDSASTCLSNIEMYLHLQENGAFLCYLLLYMGVFSIISSATLFAGTLKVFRSEHRNGWYSVTVFYLATLLVYLAQVSLYALVVGLLGYFLPLHHAIDGYAVNWLRLGHFIFFIWLLAVYMQSVGQLVGLLLVDYLEGAILLSALLFISSSMVNGFFVDTEGSGSRLLQEGSNLIGLKFISWGLLYTIYALERCNLQTHFSIYFTQFHIDINRIGVNTARVVINILAVRLLTAILMFVKFEFPKWRKSAKKTALLLPEEIPKTIDLPIVYTNEIALETETGIMVETNLQAQERATNQLRGKLLLTWKNLTLFSSSSLFETVGRDERKKRRILRNLNGQVAFGTLTGLMGTSGAGKTSLLRVLNGQAKGRLGQETTFTLSRLAPIQTCFLTQDVSGHLPSRLTAKQVLVYASRLKNRGGQVDHQAIALRWLRELDLLATVDTMVDVCSGGERKRLAVALELTGLTMPNCICIDEPTSGLDSNSAETVISVLHRLVRKHPIAIITSIHQPTREILAQLDQLYVLARGGVTIYSGAPSAISEHLSGLSHQLSPTTYPIEQLIKYSCSPYTDATVQQLVALTNRSWMAQNENKENPSVCQRETQLSRDGIPPNRTRFSPHAVHILLSRYWCTFCQGLWLKQLAFAVNHLLYGVTISLFYSSAMVHQRGCIDLQADFSAFCSTNLTVYQASTLVLYDNFMYSFFVANFFLVFLILQFSLSFLRELDLFRNEHRNGYYSSGVFYLAASLFDLAPLLPTLLIYVAIIGHWYEAVIPGIYWSFLLLFLLTSIAIQGLAHVFALLSRRSFTFLVLQTSTVILFFIMLSNFTIHIPRLPVVYQFVANFVPGRFLFDGVMLLQYGFGRCADGDIQLILFMMGLVDADYTTSLCMLTFNILFYRLLAIYLLLRQETQRERSEKEARAQKSETKATPQQFAIL